MTARASVSAQSAPPGPPEVHDALDGRRHRGLHGVVTGATHTFHQVVVTTPGGGHVAATAHGVVVATGRKARMAVHPALCYRRGMKQPSAPGAGIAIGVAIGVAMGAALHNIGLGIALGAAFGAAFEGTARRKARNRQNTGEAVKRGEE